MGRIVLYKAQDECKGLNAFSKYIHSAKYLPFCPSVWWQKFYSGNFSWLLWTSRWILFSQVGISMIFPEFVVLPMVTGLPT